MLSSKEFLMFSIHSSLPLLTGMFMYQSNTYRIDSINLFCVQYSFVTICLKMEIIE